MPLSHRPVIFTVMLGLVSLTAFACNEQPSGAESLFDAQQRSSADTATKVAATQAPSAPTGAASPIEARHQQGDAVRAAKNATLAALGHLPLAAANWNAPTPLTFRNIRTNYDYLQVHKEFLPEGLPKANGQAVELSGAVMPIDKPPEDGRMTRFWLASPKVVMAGCVFCNPPTLGDLVYVEAEEHPLVVDREDLYRGVVVVRVLGRFFIKHQKTREGVEYLFRMDMKQVIE